MAVPLMRWRRGLFCIFCRSRRDIGRCGRLLRRRGLAWALRPARGRSDIANPFAGAAVFARAGVLLPGGAAEPIRWRERRRWRPRLALRLKRVAEYRLAVPRA